MYHADKQKGFTLIELVLAMTFVSVLLLGIALTVIQIGSIYDHGITLKDINQTGTSIASDVSQSISTSVPFSISTGAGSRYIVQTDSGTVTGGRLCLGQYSYVWNIGKAIANSSPALNKYSSGTKPIYFVRVLDPGANYCINATTSPYKTITKSDAVDLLDAGDHSLAIHAFKITSSTTTGTDTRTGEQLYAIQFTLGTNNQTALTTDASGNLTCLAPGQVGSDPSYCGVSTFSVVARAGNAVQ